MFDELIGKVKELESRLDSGSTQHWATVTQASPLRVRFDGDAAALLVTPINLVGTLTVGDRVRAELNTGQLYITNRLGGIDISGKANTSDLASYATTAALTSGLATKQAAGSYAAASHTHTVSQLTDFATTVGGTLATNNYYEKYANGQLVCRGMSVFATGSQSYTWTYPVAFVGQLPQIITNHGTTAPESLASAHSSDSLTSVIIEHDRSTAGSTTMYYSAMGRWK